MPKVAPISESEGRAFGSRSSGATLICSVTDEEQEVPQIHGRERSGTNERLLREGGQGSIGKNREERIWLHYSDSGATDEEALAILAQFEDADEVDEACEGAWVVAGFGGDLLEAVPDGVGVDVHLLGGSGDVEVGVGEGPDRFDCCGEVVV